MKRTIILATKKEREGFYGVNKKCQKCIHSCKQFKNVTIISCKMYKKAPKVAQNQA